MPALRKFSSQADPKVLKEIQDLAAREGRHFQAVLGDAMREYVAQKRRQAPRKDVLAAFHDSIEQRDELYRSLAK